MYVYVNSNKEQVDRLSINFFIRNPTMHKMHTMPETIENVQRRVPFIILIDETDFYRSLTTSVTFIKK